MYSINISVLSLLLSLLPLLLLLQRVWWRRIRSSRLLQVLIQQMLQLLAAAEWVRSCVLQPQQAGHEHLQEKLSVTQAWPTNDAVPALQHLEFGPVEHLLRFE